MSTQIPIPCALMRGGTSKGPFFNLADLPNDVPTRNKVLLSVMGSPDKRQIDGLGGAHSLTSKVGMVSLSQDENVDLDFLFAQLQPAKDTVDINVNCGNMLAAVVPFALETGLVKAQGDTTTLRVLTQNTGMLSDITVQTPNGVISYEGDAQIDGVPKTSAPIQIKFLDTAGSVCGTLLPTGNSVDQFDVAALGSIKVTCIDNGMPMVLFSAADFGCTGYESVEDLNANEALKAKIEDLRLQAALKMGLGDVIDKNYPKMCLLAAPIEGGAIHTRCFIPHVCHEAIGVLAAVTVATACVYPDSVAYGLAKPQPSNTPTLSTFSIEHPSGEFSVVLDVVQNAGQTVVEGAALLRTARLIMQGNVMVPLSVYK